MPYTDAQITAAFSKLGHDVKTAADRRDFLNYLTDGNQSNGAYRSEDAVMESLYDEKDLNTGATSLELKNYWKTHGNNDGSFDQQQFLDAYHDQAAKLKGDTAPTSQRVTPAIQHAAATPAMQHAAAAPAAISDKPLTDTEIDKQLNQAVADKKITPEQKAAILDDIDEEDMPTQAELDSAIAKAGNVERKEKEKPAPGPGLNINRELLKSLAPNGNVDASIIIAAMDRQGLLDQLVKNPALQAMFKSSNNRDLNKQNLISIVGQDGKREIASNSIEDRIFGRMLSSLGPKWAEKMAAGGSSAKVTSVSSFNQAMQLAFSAMKDKNNNPGLLKGPNETPYVTVDTLENEGFLSEEAPSTSPNSNVQTGSPPASQQRTAYEAVVPNAR